MSHNYVVIYNNFQPYKRKVSVLIKQIQDELLDDCYKFATSQDISLYYQLGEAIIINELYKQVQQIKTTTIKEASSARLLAEIYNNNFGGAIRMGKFSKKALKKAMGPKFISFVLSTCNEEHSS